MAVIASGGLVQHEAAEPDKCFRREVRRALGDLITPEAIMAIIDRLHAAGHAAIKGGASEQDLEDRMLLAAAVETQSRGYSGADVGKIVTFAFEAWDRLLPERRRARKHR
jgi:hypothetical protein